MRLSAALCPLLAAALGAPPPAPAAPPPEAAASAAGCRRVVLTDPRPGWAPAMAWSPDGARLLAPDPRAGEVFVYDAAGAPAGRLAAAGEGAPAYRNPGPLMPEGDGLVLQDGGLRLATLDAGGTPRAVFDFAGRRYPGGREVGALFNWTLTGRWVVGFADVRQADGSWRSGWYRLSRDRGPPQIERLRAVGIEDPERLFYTLGHPYAASTGERAYVLRLDVEPHLLEVDGRAPAGSGARRLAAFPDGFARRPELPPLPRIEALAAVYAAEVRATMAVGLYARAGRLYVLTRRPGDGGTVWELTGIDPASDRVVSQVRLPTAAPHLVAAPGPERWALLEKGPVLPLAEQTVRSLLLVPAEWVAGGGEPPPGCLP